MHHLAGMLFWIYAAVCAGLTLLGVYRVAVLCAWLRTRGATTPSGPFAGMVVVNEIRTDLPRRSAGAA